jgi:dTDP-4-amino-4,6-dideoxygalactose transaminase
MSELQAALGLALLPYMPEIFEARKKVVDYYDLHLQSPGLQKLKIRDNTKWNYSYYPVIFPNEQVLLKAQDRLLEKEIFPRRYFYPSLNTLPYIKPGQMPIAEGIAASILCLPLYVGLHETELDEIISCLLY